MSKLPNPIGIHAFVWSSEKTLKTFEEIAIKTKKAGYDLIELSNIDPATLDIKRLSRIIKSNELAVSLTMGMPQSADISSPDQAIAANGRAMLEDAVALVRDLGGSKVGGIIHTAHQFCQTPPTRRAWETSVNTMSQIADKAKQAGVSLNVEIVNRFENNLLNTVAQGLDYIADTGASNLYLLLDSFHMNIEEADIGFAIKTAGEKIGYFHFGESHRGFLGTGNINFSIIFDALIAAAYKEEVVFEAFSSSVSDRFLSIKTATWRNIWNDGEALANHANRFISSGLETAHIRAQLAQTVHRPNKG